VDEVIAAAPGQYLDCEGARSDHGLFEQADGHGRVAEKLFSIPHGTGADFDGGR
jgi:hypothetical protein